MKSIFLYIFLMMVVSCSPLYLLKVRNNTEKPIQIFVELKDNKYNTNFIKKIKKVKVYEYINKRNLFEVPFDSIKYIAKADKKVSKKYFFTSNLNYNFTLNGGSYTNIDPNNSISIYPFKQVFYFQNGKKCFIVPLENSENCSMKVVHKEILKKNNKKVNWITDLVQLENNL